MYGSILQSHVKSLAPLLVAASTFCATENCQAVLIAYDGFNYPAGNSLSGQSGGGSFGFTSAWSLGGVGSPQHEVASASLTDGTGTLPTSGNRGAVSSVSPMGFTSAQRQLAQPLGVAGTRRYLSVLLRPEGTLGAGEVGGYFGLELTSNIMPLFIGKPTVHQYALENIGGTGQVSSGVSAMVGEPVLLVVRADFENGIDTFRLYVNPTPGEPEPLVVSAFKSDSDVGLVNSLGTFSTGAFSFDEIRIGETFEDVVAVPEPSGVVLMAVGLCGLLAFRRLLS